MSKKPRRVRRLKFAIATGIGAIVVGADAGSISDLECRGWDMVIIPDIGITTIIITGHMATMVVAAIAIAIGGTVVMAGAIADTGIGVTVDTGAVIAGTIVDIGANVTTI